MISECSKIAFNKFNIKCLVSFADSTYEHEGIIYKAANWKKVGYISLGYYYVSKDGYVMNKKTLHNHAIKMGFKEAEYARKFEYLRVKLKKKAKYILYK
jgi:hypothetical protein